MANHIPQSGRQIRGRTLALLKVPRAVAKALVAAVGLVAEFTCRITGYSELSDGPSLIFRIAYHPRLDTDAERNYWYRRWLADGLQEFPNDIRQVKRLLGMVHAIPSRRLAAGPLVLKMTHGKTTYPRMV